MRHSSRLTKSEFFRWHFLFSETKAKTEKPSGHRSISRASLTARSRSFTCFIRCPAPEALDRVTENQKDWWKTDALPSICELSVPELKAFRPRKLSSDILFDGLTFASTFSKADCRRNSGKWYDGFLPSISEIHARNDGANRPLSASSSVS